MVDRCRRAMLSLKDQCRRERVAVLQARHGPSPGASTAAAAAAAAAAASDGLAFSRTGTNGSRTVDDIQVLQIRQLAGMIIIIMHDLYSAMESEDTEALGGV